MYLYMDLYNCKYMYAYNESVPCPICYTDLLLHCLLLCSGPLVSGPTSKHQQYCSQSVYSAWCHTLQNEHSMILSEAKKGDKNTEGETSKGHI